MRLLSFAFLFLLAVATGGCAAAAPPPASGPTASPAGSPPTSVGAASQPVSTPTPGLFPQTITDDAGRQMTLAQPPRRIVSMSAGSTEILYALGLEDRVVGVDDYSNFPESTKGKPHVGGFANPDLEKILALDPDLVLATAIHVKTTVPDLEKRGLKVLVVDPKQVKGVMDSLRLVGKVTGQQERAETVAAGLSSRIAGVEARVAGKPPVRVFYELSPDLYTAGPGTYVDDLLRIAGGANIAAGAGKQWPQLNQESLLLADPEVILLADHPADQDPTTVTARPGWQQVSAVKNGRIITVNDDLTNRPGPRVVEGLEFVANTLHPAKGN